MRRVAACACRSAKWCTSIFGIMLQRVLRLLFRTKCSRQQLQWICKRIYIFNDVFLQWRRWLSCACVMKIQHVPFLSVQVQLKLLSHPTERTSHVSILSSTYAFSQASSGSKLTFKLILLPRPSTVWFKLLHFKCLMIILLPAATDGCGKHRWS